MQFQPPAWGQNGSWAFNVWVQQAADAGELFQYLVSARDSSNGAISNTSDVYQANDVRKRPTSPFSTLKQPNVSCLFSCGQLHEKASINNYKTVQTSPIEQGDNLDIPSHPHANWQQLIDLERHLPVICRPGPLFRYELPDSVSLYGIQQTAIA